MRFPRLLSLLTVAAPMAGCDGDGPSNLTPAASFTVQCNLLDCTLSNGSNDPDGTIEAYDWDFGDGSARLATRHAAHTYAAGGRFTVTLRVTDDDRAIATATAEVNVRGAPNLAPVAAFTTTCTELVCTFTNQSFDRDAGSLTYNWDFGDGSTMPATRDAAHTYPSPGRFTVTLNVRDDKGAAASSVAQVDVFEVTALPANFRWSCAELACGFVYNGGRPPTSYAWSFGDGQTSTEARPGHTYAAAGSYTVELTVTYGTGRTESVTHFITPTINTTVADFSVTCSGPECTFTDQSQGGVISIWHWDFGDGHTSDQQNPVHVYEVTEPTTFTVTLVAADFDVGDDEVSREITVSP